MKSTKILPNQSVNISLFQFDKWQINYRQSNIVEWDINHAILKMMVRKKLHLRFAPIVAIRKTNNVNSKNINLAG